VMQWQYAETLSTWLRK
jgi:Signal transduction histidine kinase